ncbi:response regulator transcription factor [Sulfurimonas sp. SAG-AH-194-I05]|nr:response regulator transcription factor [Sulfurimonas sp. SAG-AH-194-I05]MDF1874495.1 response regulator transcription factor [Sulfurimonas sp. SAG-AH-194-I05]
MKILLLEDDKNLHASLKAFLEMEDFVVASAFNSDDVYNLTYDNHYDLYIFDVNVPGDDGFKILQSLKNANDTTPTIYTTALVDITSVGKGFASGADDYIKKPFAPEELVIRIKSRYMKSETLRYKNISYNPSTRELLQDGLTVGLADVLGNIFHTLIVQKNKIVPTQTLFDFLEHPSANALRVNLSKLKSKLNLDIKNIRGIGYMLEDV